MGNALNEGSEPLALNVPTSRKSLLPPKIKFNIFVEQANGLLYLTGMSTVNNSKAGERTHKKEDVKVNVSVNCERPKIGDLVSVRNVMCKVTKVLPFGTIEVSAIEQNKAFRVSGLAFI